MSGSATAKTKATPKAPVNANVKMRTRAKAQQENINIKNETGEKTMKNQKLTSAEKKAMAAVATVNEMDEAEASGKDLEQLLVEAEKRGFEDMPWYFDIPKKERMRPRDVVYNVDLDRFGIFVSPARKNNLARMRLLKVASKEDVYTRDWFVPYDSLALVKRGDNLKRGFVETDREYVRRAGKISRSSHKEEAVEPETATV